MPANDGSYGVEYPGQLCEGVFPGEMCGVFPGTGFLLYENKVFSPAFYTESLKSQTGAVRGGNRDYGRLFTRKCFVWQQMRTGFYRGGRGYSIKKIILSYPDREKIANHTTIEYPLPP